MTIHVRAPATSANLGPGFDVVAVAFDLWNELEVGEGDGSPVDETHLAVRAFARYASTEGRTFTFTDRIPRERGLGSSAAVVALGLVAGAIAAGLDPDADELLAEGLPFEGHADNLAAALVGGVCLTWDGHIARVADDVPAAAIAVVPQARMKTAEARASLPQVVPHADAVFSAIHATLLGAGLASGNALLFAASTEDKLHEPYRAAHAPHLAAIRSDPPAGYLGATLSGSGPTAIVWAEKARVEETVAELAARLPDHEILHLAVTTTGAGSV
ncbi:MAG: homoserine kinase [Gaiellaceae bacterium]|nr:homoserine kinase [Gaiellaceae bacterium]MDX6470868.1 homoserine kinase [Gaiellaceae bacterium]MDX6473026.1 homoserine kinase [Gaiellaceae bacterium]